MALWQSLFGLLDDNDIQGAVSLVDSFVSPGVTAQISARPSAHGAIPAHAGEPRSSPSSRSTVGFQEVGTRALQKHSPRDPSRDGVVLSRPCHQSKLSG